MWLALIGAVASLALGAGPVAQHVKPPSTHPGCFRDSPQGECVHVCHVLVQGRAAGSDCLRRGDTQGCTVFVGKRGGPACPPGPRTAPPTAPPPPTGAAAPSP